MTRYEDKFLIPLSLLRDVEDFFVSDSINIGKQYPSRTVNSIYYDTDDFFFAKQNADSNGLRSKIRIRFYNDDFKNSNLEVKYKHFLVGKKLTVPLPVNGQIPDIESIYDKLKNYSEVELPQLNSLCPKLFVSYKRKYWLSRSLPGARITLDYSISAKEIIGFDSLDSLFDYNIPFQDICVLEVKYASQDNLSSFKEYFQGHLRLRRSKFSKYVLGLIHTSQLSMI